MKKDLLSISDLTRDEIDLILDTAEAMREIAQRPIKKVPTLRGKTVVNLFYEPSTRTRLSFESAMQRLGGSVISAEGVQFSSLYTGETIEDTIQYACDIDPTTIQVSIAAPYPGTALFREAKDNGWLAGNGLLDADGVQKAALSYPHLPDTEIFAAVERFYRRFYFRPRKMTMMAAEMLRSFEMMKRRLREGREFFSFLARRRAS